MTRAEKICYELARLVGARRRDRACVTVSRHTNTPTRGSISRDMRPPRWERNSGADLLSKRDVNFNAKTCVGNPDVIRSLNGVGESARHPLRILGCLRRLRWLPCVRRVDRRHRPARAELGGHSVPYREDVPAPASIMAPRWAAE